MLLQQLSSTPSVEPDCALEIAICRLDLQTRIGNYSAALTTLTVLAESLIRDRSDLYHRLRLMVIKADLLSKCGRPLKGLSVAVSAATLAWRARLLPVLFAAFRAIAGILIALSEFDTAYEMLDKVMPQVLECEDTELNARCFAVLAECQMGIAGGRRGEGRVGGLVRALEFIDRAFVGMCVRCVGGVSCAGVKLMRAEYSRIQDTEAMMTLMSQKARIQDFIGDKGLRDDAVKMYRQLQKGA